MRSPEGETSQRDRMFGRSMPQVPAIGIRLKPQRQRTIAVLAVSLLAHLGLGFIFVARLQARAVAEDRPIEVALINADALRPKRPAPARTPKPRAAPIPARAEPVASEEAPAARVASDVDTASPVTQVVEPRWRLSRQGVSQDETRAALRRLKGERLCTTQLEGWMTTEEKAMCERFWIRLVEQAQRRDR